MPNITPNQELLRLLFEQSTEHAVVLTDPHGRITGWNRGAERVFGFRDGEIRGQHISVLFTPEEVERGMAEHEMTTARNHGTAEDDRWMQRQDGSRFWATGVMQSIRDENGEVIGFGKLLRNRTDLREQWETLRNQIAALDDQLRRKDVFLTTLSHELRNPLSPLAYSVELIRRSSTVTPDVEHQLQVIERQVDALRRLVGDLSDLSRVGAGKVDLKKEPITINEVVCVPCKPPGRC